MESNIRQLEDDLFEQYRHQECYSNFIPDGVVSPEIWEQQEVKIIFLLKEANAEQKSFDLRTFLYGGGKWRTWNNIARWACGILENMDWKSANKASSNKAVWLQKVAVINVKKKGGKARTNKEQLIQFFDENKGSELLSKQLFLLNNVNYIICCGEGVYHCLHEAIKLNPLSDKWQFIGEQRNEENRRILLPQDNHTAPFIIDFVHPQSRRIKKEQLFSSLMKVVAYCQSKSK